MYYNDERCLLVQKQKLTDDMLELFLDKHQFIHQPGPAVSMCTF